MYTEYITRIYICLANRLMCPYSYWFSSLASWCVAKPHSTAGPTPVIATQNKSALPQQNSLAVMLEVLEPAASLCASNSLSIHSKKLNEQGLLG